jgi:hypothetical protein
MGLEGGALLGALAVTLVLAVLAAWAWYHIPGWQAFEVGLGESPAWEPAGGKPVEALRFRRASFAVRRPDGAAKEADVTGNLNAMAAGLKGAKGAPAALTLAAPLGGFSFPIAGFNDPASGEGPGWCPPGGACPAAPLEAKLTGEYRTV